MRTLATLELRPNGNASLQTQVSAQIRQLIQKSELAAGERLPSSRDLATQLHVSRNTVIAAYETLLSEGYLESHPRSGIYVGTAAAAFGDRPTAEQPAARVTRSEARTRIQFNAPRPFRPTQPDVTLFPMKVWNRERSRILRSGANILHYQSIYSLGLDSLRKSLSQYLRDSRGVHCSWQQIAITSGSQNALFLLGQLLLKPGDSVYVEDPGYPGASRAWQAAGARLIPLPIDEEGVCIPKQTSSHTPLISVTPSRQFPLGMCMSLARRLALLDAAVKMRCWIVEDDYDSEFRYNSAPLPSLQNLDRAGRVIYVGSFSKILFPTLRLGYIVLPPLLVDRFAKLKSVSDDHGPMIEQATLAAFLDSGGFYTHLRRCRKHYAERQLLFLEEVRRRKIPLSFPHIEAGMNLAGLLPAGTDDRIWSERLNRAGLDVPPLSRYAIASMRPGLLFGLTAFEPKVIRDGVARLAKVLLGHRGDPKLNRD